MCIYATEDLLKIHRNTKKACKKILKIHRLGARSAPKPRRRRGLYGFPIVFPRLSNDFRMIFPWFSHDFPMISPWFPYHRLTSWEWPVKYFPVNSLTTKLQGSDLSPWWTVVQQTVSIFEQQYRNSRSKLIKSIVFLRIDLGPVQQYRERCGSMFRNSSESPIYLHLRPFNVIAKSASIFKN